MLKKSFFYLKQLAVIFLPFFIIRRGTSSFDYYLIVSFSVLTLSLFIDKRPINFKGKWVIILGVFFTTIYSLSLWRHGLHSDAKDALFLFGTCYIGLFLFSQINIHKKTYTLLGISAIASIWMPMVNALSEWHNNNFQIYRLSGEWEVIIFSIYMGIFFMITLYLILNNTKKYYKIPLFITHFTCLSLLVLSQSRMTWLVAFCGVIFIILLSNKKHLILYLLTLLCVAIVAAPFTIKSGLYKRVTYKLSTYVNYEKDNSTGTRIYTWEESIRQIKDDFWFGNGGYKLNTYPKYPKYAEYAKLKEGNYAEFSKLPLEEKTKTHAYAEVEHSHNGFLEMTLVGGIFTTITFILMLGIIFYQLFIGSIREWHNPMSLYPYVFLIFIMYIGHNITDVLYINVSRFLRAFWLSYGLLLASTNTSNKNKNNL